MNLMEVMELCVISNTKIIVVGQHGKVNGWQKHNEKEDKNTDFVVIRLNYHNTHEIADTRTYYS